MSAAENTIRLFVASNRDMQKKVPLYLEVFQTLLSIAKRQEGKITDDPGAAEGVRTFNGELWEKVVSYLERIVKVFEYIHEGWGTAISAFNDRIRQLDGTNDRNEKSELVESSRMLLQEMVNRLGMLVTNDEAAMALKQSPTVARAEDKYRALVPASDASSVTSLASTKETSKSTDLLIKLMSPLQFFNNIDDDFSMLCHKISEYTAIIVSDIIAYRTALQQTIALLKTYKPETPKNDYDKLVTAILKAHEESSQYESDVRVLEREKENGVREFDDDTSAQTTSTPGTKTLPDATATKPGATPEGGGGDASTDGAAAGATPNAAPPLESTDGAAAGATPNAAPPLESTDGAADGAAAPPSPSGDASTVETSTDDAVPPLQPEGSASTSDTAQKAGDSSRTETSIYRAAPLTSSPDQELSENVEREMSEYARKLDLRQMFINNSSGYQATKSEVLPFDYQLILAHIMDIQCRGMIMAPTGTGKSQMLSHVLAKYVYGSDPDGPFPLLNAGNRRKDCPTIVIMVNPSAQSVDLKPGNKIEWVLDEEAQESDTEDKKLLSSEQVEITPITEGLPLYEVNKVGGGVVPEYLTVDMSLKTAYLAKVQDNMYYAKYDVSNETEFIAALRDEAAQGKRVLGSNPIVTDGMDDYEARPVKRVYITITTPNVPTDAKLRVDVKDKVTNATSVYRAARKTVLDEFREYVEKSPLCHNLLDRIHLEELNEKTTQIDFPRIAKNPNRVFVVEHDDFLVWCTSFPDRAKLFLAGCNFIIDEIHKYMSILEQSLRKDDFTMYNLAASPNGMLPKKLANMSEYHPLKVFFDGKDGLSITQDTAPQLFNALGDRMLMGGIDSAAGFKPDIMRFTRYLLCKTGLVPLPTGVTLETLNDISSLQRKNFEHKLSSEMTTRALLHRFKTMKADSPEKAMAKAVAAAFLLRFLFRIYGEDVYTDFKTILSGRGRGRMLNWDNEFVQYLKFAQLRPRNNKSFDGGGEIAKVQYSSPSSYLDDEVMSYIYPIELMYHAYMRQDEFTDATTALKTKNDNLSAKSQTVEQSLKDATDDTQREALKRELATVNVLIAQTNASIIESTKKLESHAMLALLAVSSTEDAEAYDNGFLKEQATLNASQLNADRYAITVEDKGPDSQLSNPLLYLFTLQRRGIKEPSGAGRVCGLTATPQVDYKLYTRLFARNITVGSFFQDAAKPMVPFAEAATEFVSGETLKEVPVSDSNVICIRHEETAHLMAHANLNLTDDAYSKSCDSKNYIRSWGDDGELENILVSMLKHPLKTLILYTKESYLPKIKSAIRRARPEGPEYAKDVYENFDQFNNVNEIMQMRDAMVYRELQLKHILERRWRQGLRSEDDDPEHIKPELKPILQKSRKLSEEIDFFKQLILKLTKDDNRKIFVGTYNDFGTGVNFKGVRRLVKIGFCDDTDGNDRTKIRQADGRGIRLDSSKYLDEMYSDVRFYWLPDQGCNPQAQALRIGCDADGNLKKEGDTESFEKVFEQCVVKDAILKYADPSIERPSLESDFKAAPKIGETGKSYDDRVAELYKHWQEKITQDPRLLGETSTFAEDTEELKQVMAAVTRQKTVVTEAEAAYNDVLKKMKEETFDGLDDEAKAKKKRALERAVEDSKDALSRAQKRQNVLLDSQNEAKEKVEKSQQHQENLDKDKRRRDEEQAAQLAAEKEEKDRLLKEAIAKNIADANAMLNTVYPITSTSNRSDVLKTFEILASYKYRLARMNDEQVMEKLKSLEAYLNTSSPEKEPSMQVTTEAPPASQNVSPETVSSDAAAPKAANPDAVAPEAATPAAAQVTANPDAADTDAADTDAADSDAAAPKAATPTADSDAAAPKAATPTADSDAAAPKAATPTADSDAAAPKAATPTADSSNAAVPDAATPTADSDAAAPKAATPTADSSNAAVPDAAKKVKAPKLPQNIITDFNDFEGAAAEFKKWLTHLENTPSDPLPDTYSAKLYSKMFTKLLDSESNKAENRKSISGSFAANAELPKKLEQIIKKRQTTASGRAEDAYYLALIDQMFRGL